MYSLKLCIVILLSNYKSYYRTLVFVVSGEYQYPQIDGFPQGQIADSLLTFRVFHVHVHFAVLPSTLLL